MIPMHAFKAVSASSFRTQLPLRLTSRTYAAVSTDEKDAADLNIARSWYSHFNKSTIPMSIAKTKIVKASASGASKGNKTNPKVINLWPMKFLLPNLPKLLHTGLYSSTYYVPSLDAIQVDCDTHPSQHENGEETQRRLKQEIRRIYKALTGAIPPVQEEEIDGLQMKESVSVTPWSPQGPSITSPLLAYPSQPAFIALRGRRLRITSSDYLRSRLDIPQQSRHYSSSARKESEEADLEAARTWFRSFNQSTIPTKVAKTVFVRSSGAGGQKVNKTSSKADTTWDLDSLLPYIPKILHPDIRESRYYVRSSNSMAIKCDSHRSREDNAKETHKRLVEEITKIYKDRVPGVTDPEQKKRVVELSAARREQEKGAKTRNFDAGQRHNNKRVLNILKNEKKKQAHHESEAAAAESKAALRAARQKRERELWSQKKPKK